MGLVDRAYADLIANVLTDGDEITTRNSKVKRLIDAAPMTFDAAPLISVRKTAWKLALREWEWISKGSSNVNDLHPSVRHWWTPWADSGGRVRYGYGEQLRSFTGDGRRFDQLQEFVKGIDEHPFSRRHVITTWNPLEMYATDCSITNCHNTVTQAFVGGDGSISLKTYQRSVDVVCGLPHNLIQMWAFLLWLGDSVKRRPGKLIWIGGDVHVYDKHFDLAQRILDSVDQCGPTPSLSHIGLGWPQDFDADEFVLGGEYKPVLTDRAEMVV